VPLRLTRIMRSTTLSRGSIRLSNERNIISDAICCAVLSGILSSSVQLSLLCLLQRSESLDLLWSLRNSILATRGLLQGCQLTGLEYLLHLFGCSGDSVWKTKWTRHRIRSGVWTDRHRSGIRATRNHQPASKARVLS